MSNRDDNRGPVPSQRTPFSFKLMVAMAVLYLGWRLVEGIAAFIRWIR
ncbi:MAG: hypothetical protein OXF41_03495 [bacterium]|nr:hypothetical protein [bacterium]